jgi:predicted DNA-binding protein YlxM (UPF0122 family)
MAALYQQGWSLKQIGEKFGLSKQAVHQRFQIIGISRKDRDYKRKFDKIDKSDFERLYSDGKSLNDIAEYFSTSAWTIQRTLKFYKIPKRYSPGKWGNLFRSMKIDESRVVECNHVRPHITLHSLAVRKGIKISIKKVGENQFQITRRK